MLLQERPVDQLDMDAAVLHRLDGIGDLHQLPSGSFRVGKGALVDEFHEVSPTYLLISTCVFPCLSNGFCFAEHFEKRRLVDRYVKGLQGRVLGTVKAGH
jgi:hypothetical protein